MAVTRSKLPVATGVDFTDKEVVFNLSNGGKLLFPLSDFPRLGRASSEERNGWELLYGGESIRWETIDEDVSIPLLLTGSCK
ncbi:MAG: DUF2442 domain-containing protein [Thermaerobacter sp.]|jgi:hypothetical protein|nr:DUF2442 domain-containing protein [Thermaerobacter sp.]